MLLLWRIDSFETFALLGYVSRYYTVNMFAYVFPVINASKLTINWSIIMQND